MKLEIKTQNETLAKMTTNIKKAKEKRNVAVTEIVNAIIADAKELKASCDLSNKNAVSIVIKNLDIKGADAYTKRALKVAITILNDSYKLKRELLSLSQMEQLICFNVAQVNGLMKFEGDEYIAEAKELINRAKIEKTTKVFSAKKAKAVK